MLAWRLVRDWKSLPANPIRVSRLGRDSAATPARNSPPQFLLQLHPLPTLTPSHRQPSSTNPPQSSTPPTRSVSQSIAPLQKPNPLCPFFDATYILTRVSYTLPDRTKDPCNSMAFEAFEGSFAVAIFHATDLDFESRRFVNIGKYVGIFFSTVFVGIGYDANSSKELISCCCYFAFSSR